MARKKETANRPSQAGQEFVTTKDGRRVRNLAYDPSKKKVKQEAIDVTPAMGKSDDGQPREFVVYFLAYASTVARVRADSKEEATDKVWDVFDYPDPGYGAPFEASGDWDYDEEGIEDNGDGTYSVPMVRCMQSNFPVEATSFKEAETAALDDFEYPGTNIMQNFDLGDWEPVGIYDSKNGTEVQMEYGHVVGNSDERKVSELGEDDIVFFVPEGYSVFRGVKFTPHPKLKSRAGVLSVDGETTEDTRYVDEAGKSRTLLVFGSGGDDGSAIEYGISNTDKASAIIADEFVRLGGDPSLGRKIKVKTSDYGRVPTVGAEMEVPASAREVSLSDLSESQAEIFGLAVHNMTKGSGELFRKMADPYYGY